MARVFLFCLLNLLPKFIVRFQTFSSFFSPKVNSVFYPKTKRYLYLEKNEKKAQEIIFHGVKTKQCMSHVSTKNKVKHEGVIFGNTKECMTHISTKI